VKKDKDGYGYLAIVIVAWGVVPAFAKLGNLSGDITTFYVNLIAVLAVALLITVKKAWKLFRELSVKDFLLLGSLGLVWPLLYSVTYFQSVKEGGAALTTILNYSWPVFALAFGFILNKSKPTRASVVGVLFAVGAVSITCWLENSHSSIVIALPVLALGLTAGASQGFFNEGNRRLGYDPWVTTFIVEVVTAIGVTVFVLLRGSFVVPSWTSFGYLAVIGAISNGIGFWAFASGGKKGDENPRWRGIWLAGNCLVPLSQALLLPIFGAEQVSPWKWLGIGLVTIGLVIVKLGNK